MRIDSIGYTNKIATFKSNLNNKLFFNSNNDVFVKSLNNVQNINKNDDDLSFEAFLDWYRLNSEFLEKSGHKGKLIGSGFEGTVYEFNGTDNWVIKESKRSSFIPFPVREPEIIKIPDDFPTLNIGQPIAKVTLPKNANFSYTFYVLKKQKGNSLGIAPNELNINSYSVSKHLKSLILLSDAPQRTYDKLIQDISEISEKGYEIDCCNPNNVLFDESKQSINFVDINKLDIKQQFGNVLYALLDTEFEKVLRENPNDDNTIEFRKKYIKEICEKYFKAMKNQGVVFHLEYFFTILLNSSLLDDYLHSNTESGKVETLIKKGLM